MSTIFKKIEQLKHNIELMKEHQCTSILKEHLIKLEAESHNSSVV